MKKLVTSLLCLLVLSGCASKPNLERFEYVELIMASPARLVLYAENEETARKSARAVYDELHSLDKCLSDWNTQSELNLLVKSAPEKVAISPSLHDALKQAKFYSQSTNGAYDPTVGPIIKLWREARKNKSLPKTSQLKKAQSFVDLEAIELTPGHARIARVGVQIDLGGIGKGIALDRAGEILRKHNIKHHLIDLGGDVQVGAPPPDSAYWVVSIFPGEVTMPLELELANQTAATSGDLFQYVEIDGVRYGHIVDPQSGLALEERRQATVISTNGAQSDALSTAGCVLGPTAFRKLLEKRFPKVSAVMMIYTEQGDSITMIANPPVRAHDAP